MLGATSDRESSIVLGYEIVVEQVSKIGVVTADRTESIDMVPSTLSPGCENKLAAAVMLLRTRALAGRGTREPRRNCQAAAARRAVVAGLVAARWSRCRDRRAAGARRRHHSAGASTLPRKGAAAPRRRLMKRYWRCPSRARSTRWLSSALRVYPGIIGLLSRHGRANGSCRSRPRCDTGPTSSRLSRQLLEGRRPRPTTPAASDASSVRRPRNRRWR